MSKIIKIITLTLLILAPTACYGHLKTSASSPPVAEFTYIPEKPLINETVVFDASASYDPDGTIVAYVWDFGDGNTGSGAIVTHSYTDFGIYTVTLTVTDSEGLSDVYTVNLKILINPVANFTYTPLYPEINQTITFNATYSFDPDGTIINYLWDFGDGNITQVSTPIITHTYISAGTYKVTLTVTDNDGLTDTFELLISVYTYVPLHDVAVINVTISSSWAYKGDLINITVTVKNQGETVEKFNVTIYCNETEIEVYPIGYLPAGATFTFTWNTSQVPPGIYTISVTASPVPLESNTANNIMVDGTVVVVFIDLNGDGKIDITDVATVAVHYGEIL